MRRLHTLAPLAALAGLAVVPLLLAWTQIPPQPVPPRIQCQGLACGGNGGPNPRAWSYWVIPGGDGVNRVDIGVHYPMAWITQQVMPTGWSVQLIEGPTPDDLVFTPHGQLTSPTGNCPYILRWSGPTQFAPFQLGHSAGQGRHDTEWDTGGQTMFVNGVANWGRPVGGGYGPVHSARFGPIPVQEGDEEPPMWPAEWADAPPHGADADAAHAH